MRTFVGSVLEAAGDYTVDEVKDGFDALRLLPRADYDLVLMDIHLPGMVYAVVARPPVFGAKPRTVDDSAARAIRGVKAVLRVPLDRGAEGIAVIAEGYWPAKQGRDALKIDWDTSGVEKVDALTWRIRIKGKGLRGRLSRKTRYVRLARTGTYSASVGLFTYPILQAADILLYDAEIVPVGEDQRQHIELTRDLAHRFNTRFGDTFVLPEPRILPETAKIYDLQNPGSKMSKSGESPQGILWLLDEPSVNAKKIRSAVTDTSRDVLFDPVEKPGVSNLLTILSVLTRTPIPALVDSFAGKGYGDLKAQTADAVVAEFEPVRAAALELLADPAELDRVLAGNADRANAIAEATLKKAYDRVGFLPRA